MRAPTGGTIWRWSSCPCSSPRTQRKRTWRFLTGTCSAGLPVRVILVVTWGRMSSAETGSAHRLRPGRGGYGALPWLRAASPGRPARPHAIAPSQVAVLAVGAARRGRRVRAGRGGDRGGLPPSPVWPDKEQIIHWDIEDPVSKLQSANDEEKQIIVRNTFNIISSKIKDWVNE